VGRSGPGRRRLVGAIWGDLALDFLSSSPPRKNGDGEARGARLHGTSGARVAARAAEHGAGGEAHARGPSSCARSRSQRETARRCRPAGSASSCSAFCIGWNTSSWHLRLAERAARRAPPHFLAPCQPGGGRALPPDRALRHLHDAAALTYSRILRPFHFSPPFLHRQSSPRRRSARTTWCRTSSRSRSSTRRCAGTARAGADGGRKHVQRRRLSDDYAMASGRCLRDR
jgi:hypothetical protein